MTYVLSYGDLHETLALDKIRYASGLTDLDRAVIDQAGGYIIQLMHHLIECSYDNYLEYDSGLPETFSIKDYVANAGFIGYMVDAIDDLLDGHQFSPLELQAIRSSNLPLIVGLMRDHIVCGSHITLCSEFAKYEFTNYKGETFGGETYRRCDLPDADEIRQSVLNTLCINRFVA